MMKLLFCTLLGLLISELIMAQDQNEMISFFKIGDSIEKYKDVINCAENNNTSRYSSESKCRSYRYLPAEQDSISIANINFGIIFLLPNLQKKIVTISFIRHLIGKDSIKLRIEIEREFTTLINSIDSFYKMKGSKLNIEESEFYTGDSIVWNKNNITTSLRKFISIKRKSKRKTVYINTLDLSIY